MAKKSLDQDYQKQIENSIKMFDVAKPGSSRPATTSRPVIVGHKSALSQDPMVKGEETEIESTPVAPEVSKPKKKTIKVSHVSTVKHKKPITKAPKKDKAQPKPEISPELVKVETHKKLVLEPLTKLESTTIAEEPNPVKDEEVAESPAPIKANEVPQASSIHAQESSKEENATESKPEETTAKEAVVDSLVEQVSDKKKEEKELAEVAVRLEEIQRAIDSKEYYLPITTTEQKRTMQIVATVIFIAVLAAGAAFLFGPEREKINSVLNLK